MSLHLQYWLDEWSNWVFFWKAHYWSYRYHVRFDWISGCCSGDPQNVYFSGLSAVENPWRSSFSSITHDVVGENQLWQELKAKNNLTIKPISRGAPINIEIRLVLSRLDQLVSIRNYQTRSRNYYCSLFRMKFLKPSSFMAGSLWYLQGSWSGLSIMGILWFQNWTDRRLSWDSNVLRKNIHFLRLHSGSIWAPDITLTNRWR